MPPQVIYSVCPNTFPREPKAIYLPTDEHQVQSELPDCQGLLDTGTKVTLMLSIHSGAQVIKGVRPSLSRSVSQGPMGSLRFHGRA